MNREQMAVDELKHLLECEHSNFRNWTGYPLKFGQDYILEPEKHEGHIIKPDVYGVKKISLKLGLEVNFKIQDFEIEPDENDIVFIFNKKDLALPYGYFLDVSGVWENGVLKVNQISEVFRNTHAAEDSFKNVGKRFSFLNPITNEIESAVFLKFENVKGSKNIVCVRENKIVSFSEEYFDQFLN